MKVLLCRCYKHLSFNVSLCLLFLFFSGTARSLAQQEEVNPSSGPELDDKIMAIAVSSPEGVGKEISWSLTSGKPGAPSESDRYTINFKNVSIIEYVKFISKITGNNFVYDEGDMQFTVTIVSEEPISLKNIMSALIQTLRIHNLIILEQDNNFIITKNHDVNQIPTIVSDEHKDKRSEKAPIITRIFRIKNANVTSLAGIIRPMMSVTAMVDVSSETRQLIVTDISTNVDKVATLLASLDAPHTPLEIDTYSAKFVAVKDLIALVTPIVTPFADGNAFILVPQNETNSIYLVSTPYLIERAMGVMEDLDVPPKKGTVKLSNEEVFIYKIQNRSAADLMVALKKVGAELEEVGATPSRLVEAINQVKWIKESNSLLFVTDDDTLKKVKEIMATLDSTGAGEISGFYIYRIQQAGEDQIQNSLKDLASSLRIRSQNKGLVEAIESMRFIKEIHSLIFTGDEDSLKKLADLLPTVDTSVALFSPTSHFWIYTPQYLTGKEIESSLQDIQDNLKAAGLTDTALLSAIESKKWIPATNSLVFAGEPKALENIQAVMKFVDVAAGSPSKIFLYNPKYVSKEQIEEALDQLADKLDLKNLSDKNLAKAIDTMTWINESQTFLFKTDPSTVEKLQSFLNEIDNQTEAGIIKNAFFVYKLKYAEGDAVIAHLTKISRNLKDADISQKAIIDTVKRMTWLPETNSLLITGPQKAVDDLKLLIAQFDTEEALPPSSEKTSFFIYKPLHRAPDDIEKALEEIAKDLKESGLIDPNLLQTIQTMRFVESTESFVFTGSDDSLHKMKEILATVDVVGVEGMAAEIAGQTFMIYKVKYTTPQQLMHSLKTIGDNLEKSHAQADKELGKALLKAKWLTDNNAFLFTGSPLILDKVKAVLAQLDVMGTEGVPIRGQPAFIIYKPQHLTGKDLITILCDFEDNLIQSGVNDAGLFDAINNLKWVDKTSSLLISGDKESIAKVQELLQKFDVTGGAGQEITQGQESSFLVYKLQYQQGADILEALKQITVDLTGESRTTNKPLMEAINSLQIVKVTNSLLATGSPEVLTNLRELIQNLDVPLRQVFIEILIIQTTLSDSQDIGLQWGGKIQYLNKFAGGTGNLPTTNPNLGTQNLGLQIPLTQVNATVPPNATMIAPSTSAINTPNSGFDLGVIGDIIMHKGRSFISLASLVNAIQFDLDSTVIVNPKMLTQDNMNSTIFVGQNIPFAGSTVIQTGQVVTTSTNLEYRDVGINVSITPTLGRGDMITLEITTDLSQQVANTTSGTNGIQGLQTSHANMVTRVQVPNRHFLALSGMIQDTKSHFRSGIPCLGGLPVIGLAFADDQRTDSKNNIIMFVRPYIVDTFEDYKKITDDQEQLYKDQSGLQILKEQFDAGVDWIKKPEDE